MEEMGDRRRSALLLKEACRLIQDAPKPWSNEALSALATTQIHLSAFYKSNHQYQEAEATILSAMAIMQSQQRKGVIKVFSMYYIFLSEVEVRDK